MASIAKGSPTKDFFVEMLTRDISLSDSILDLLDNCLDGVVRQKGDSEKRNNPTYYSGFYSHITITEKSFNIEDNCGGIPRDVAEEQAFRMGRPPEKANESLPTVGIYGIGMKRAIFKIGRSASVTTRNKDALYRVTIPKEWTTSEDRWDFPIDELDDQAVLTEGGTIISISDINPSISELWNNYDKLEKFINDLIKSIQQSYSFIIQKGFEITINGEPVPSLPVNLLISEEIEKDKKETIKPFLYKQTFGDVSVSLAVGFYAPPPSPEDLDDENKLKRASEDAGWTVVCNDRVVLYNDRSHLTGWGEAGVPHYHTQFIGIRGVVIFESSNPKNLPMTTTKRGIDTSSSIYSAVKDRMRQGLKMFTDYTNWWKGRNADERVYSANTKLIDVDDLMAPTEEVEKTSPVTFRQSKGGYIFTPSLPKPSNDKPYKRISYSKSADEIGDVVEFLYKDRDHQITPSQVGEKCFDIILEQAHSNKGGE